ncbi:MAG: EamA family transporter [Saprospiraceae bacterium]|nr:EamA family transporter [Saprospiraceae bacterium]
MSFNSESKAYIQIHIAVLLFGLTAILGHLLSISAVSLVWWRVLITCISLLYFIKWGKSLVHLPKNHIRQYMGIGVIVGLHWICFYGAIKLSNASIALVCMATTSFFTSIIEPLILKQKFKGIELLLGIFIIPGMILIVNSTELAFMNGIWVGLAAAFLAALFAVLNKKYIGNADPYSITFIELGSAWIFISLILAVIFLSPIEDVSFMPVGLNDWIYLLILSLFCTTLAYILSLKALKHISAFASNLVINLEPVYGIILAIILLNEHKSLNGTFYIGCSIIVFTVMLYPLLTKRFRK